MRTNNDEHAFRENESNFDEHQGEEGGIQDRGVSDIVAGGQFKFGRRRDVEESKQDS